MHTFRPLAPLLVRGHGGPARAARKTQQRNGQHFGFPTLFADPYKMVRIPTGPRLDLRAGAFHHQMGMTALDAGKHLYCEWPLAATTEPGSPDA